MDFNELYKSIRISEQSVLELVDEYTLYCHYTGIDPLIIGKAYNAPYYRQDNCPSFSVFESKHREIEFMWKDHTTGDSGTIFNLIQKIEGLANKNEVLALINEDFALGYNTQSPLRKDKIVWYDRPEQNDIKIQIVSQPLTKKALNYWQQYEVTEDLLRLYNVSQVKYLWLYEGQLCPTTVNDLTFSYRIGEFYQIYSPYNPKNKKFRNDLPENYFFGYLQLPQSGEILIIDKSFKDLIFCKRLGYSAVAPKSETTMIPNKKMLELFTRFNKIYITFDPDPAGIKMTEKYLQLYPNLIPKTLPFEKDKTDLCKKVGFTKTKEIVDGLFI